MYKDSVTLFNRYRDKQRNVLWYPTVLHNVNLIMDKVYIIAKYGHESSDNAVLNVRYGIENLAKGEPPCQQIPWLKGEKLMVGGKMWLPDNEWNAQEEEMLPKIIKFEAGNGSDFFWFGEWTGESVISDSAYPSDEGFYGYMNRTQDYVFEITAVGGPYTVIPHFEIMGR